MSAIHGEVPLGLSTENHVPHTGAAWRAQKNQGRVREGVTGVTGEGHDKGLVGLIEDSNAL